MRLGPVLESMKQIKKLGIWLEVTTLVIPGINDDPEEISDAVDFIVKELGVDTPWHISAFFPTYKMNKVPPTPISTLKRAYETGRAAGLRYVYLGNTGSDEDTICHQCGAVVIRRSGGRMVTNLITSGGSCTECGAAIAGIGMGAW